MIEIKITGASIPELADKLTAIGRALRNQSSYEADNAAREAMQAARDAARALQAKVDAQIVAEQAAEIAEGAEKKMQATRKRKAAEVVVEQTETSTAVAIGDDIKINVGNTPPKLTYANDIMPAVLAAVERSGRDKIAAILATFDAKRASEVPEDRWADLLEAINA